MVRRVSSGEVGIMEWDSEPDRVEFIHCGLRCLILRGPMGSLNGYVELPESSSAWGMDHMWENPFEVHGGITFSGTLDQIMQEETYYAVGFDTAHAWDVIPKLNGRWPIEDNSTYKNLEFVTNETKSLAEQIQATLPNPAALDLFK